MTDPARCDDKVSPARLAQFIRLAARCVPVLVLLGACTGGSHELERQAAPDPVRTASDSADAIVFVNHFYERYLALVSQSTREPAYYTLIAEDSSTITDTLRSVLRNERRLQEAAGGAIVRLDSDPFVGSQDPCERYAGASAVRDGVMYRVQVYAVCGGDRQPSPSVVVEVRRSAASWAVRDIVYPGAGTPTLLAVLALPP